MNVLHRVVAGVVLLPVLAQGATPGLPFTEDFVDRTLGSATYTTANWSTYNPPGRMVLLPEARRQFGDFFTGDLGSDVAWDWWSQRVATAVGDVDGDGDLDLVVASKGEGTRLYLNDHTAASPFVGATGITVGGDTPLTTAVALADMNGDGRLDLVLANYQAPIAIYFNNRSSDPFGGVSKFEVAPTDILPTEAMAVGDLNGDGYPDIVTGNYGAPSRYYLNNRTLNPFAGVAGLDLTTDAVNTNSIALGDIDNDGHLDVVIGAEGIERYYLNNGAPVPPTIVNPFDGVAGRDVGMVADGATSGLALGDMDGDGLLDLVVTAGDVGWYRNQGAPGYFDSASIKLAAIEVMQDARSVQLSDADGDGDLDILAGDTGVLSPVLFRNGGGLDPFVDREYSLFPNCDTEAASCVAADIVSLAVGDMDGDGDPDLVAGNKGGMSRLYLNFRSPNPFSGTGGSNVDGSYLPGTNTAVGDVDNDGYPDLVMVPLNPVSGVAQSRLYLNDRWNPFVAATPLGVAGQARAAVLADMDGNGRLDLILAVQGGPGQLYLNTGAPPYFDFSIYQDIGVGAIDAKSLAVGDVNGDGHPDVLLGTGGGVGSPTLLFLHNGTNVPFSSDAGISLNDNDDTYGLALGDLNGDGKPDLVTGNYNQPQRVFLNAGGANPFNGPPQDVGIAGSLLWDDTLRVALGDMNRDGRLDLVVGNNLAPVYYYLNNGGLAPFVGVTPRMVSADANGGGGGLALGDVDGDGGLDVVVGNKGKPDRLYLNNGTAVPFSGLNGYDISSDPDETTDLAMADMDLDGDLDLITGNKDTPAVQYYRNGRGSNPLRNVFATNITPDVVATRAVATGDLDRDGKPDVVTGDYGSGLHIYPGNGVGDPFALLTGGIQLGGSLNTTSVALADMDGDGDLDLILGTFGGGNFYFANLSTPGNLQFDVPTAITAARNITTSLAVGDIDGDGKPDLVVGNYGVNYLYLNDGAGNPFDTLAGGLGIGTESDTTTSVALGDIDLDGDLDLVVGNVGGVSSRVYLNFGGGFGTSAYFSTPETLLVRAVLLTDVDKDGDLDWLVGTETGIFQYTNDIATPPYFGSAIPWLTEPDVTPPHNVKVTAMVAVDLDMDGDPDLAAGMQDDATVVLENQWGFFGNVPYYLPGTTVPVKALAAGDLNRDGKPDLVEGNEGRPNRLFQRRPFFDTTRDRAGSLRVDAEVAAILGAMLTTTTGTGDWNTALDYYLSNDGGASWYQVYPDRPFTFPTDGIDLRWRVRLRSLSPFHTPRLQQLQIGNHMPDTLRFSQASHSIPEGDATYRLAVSRVGMGHGAAAVDFGLLGAAARGVGAPPSVQPGWLFWADGDTGDKFIDVQIHGDFVDEGNENYYVELLRSIGARTGILNQTQLTIVDNDTAGFTIAPATPPLYTSEAGGMARFELALTSEPTANVTVAFASSDATEGVVTPAQHLFTPSDWNVPHYVTVVGVADLLVDGDQPYLVTSAAAVSGDPDYAGLNPPDLSLVNRNDDGKLDLDGDGLTLAEEQSLGTNPNNRDSDGDRLDDGVEVHLLRTDPRKADSDNDGISDGAEDPDGDRLTSLLELADLGTDPTKPDSDGNGVNDRNEDADGDGLGNGLEIFTLGTDPALPDSDSNGTTDDLEDPDGDGVGTGDEVYLHFTDPLDPDSDVDGIDDGAEVALGDSPLTPRYHLAAGWYHTCVVDDSGVQCWGRNDGGQLGIPADLADPIQVAAGPNHACAIVGNGANPDAVRCWGKNDAGELTVPADLANPRLVALGEKLSCALADGGMQCWGGGGLLLPLPGDLSNPRRIALGRNHACVIEDSGLACWGFNGDGQATPPPDLIHPRQVAVGELHTCALHDLGVRCWGQNLHGQTAVPALVNPRLIFAGDYTSCALDDAGLHCWGQNEEGETTVPTLNGPKFGAAGLAHICALDDTGVHCWGGNRYGQTNVPAGLSFGAATPATDTDRDGMPDQWESDHGLDPAGAGDAGADPEGDGLTNLEEYRAATDPHNPDSDGDAVPDGIDSSPALFNPCQLGDALIADHTFLTGSDFVCRTTGSIRLTRSTVQSGARVDLTAPAIRLQAGVVVQPGGQLRLSTTP